MPNDSVFPKSLLAAALSAAFPNYVLAQAAARIDFAVGQVTAQGADGRARALTKGAEVGVGETVNTQNGRAQMRFSDGAYVSLQPQTEFKIDSYAFEGRGSPNENAVMSLIKGGMRTITGLIGRTNRNGYRLRTSTATVGIRGTEYSVTYDAGGSVTMFVANGAIAVSNRSGTTVVPGGTSINIANEDSPPASTDELPVLPPQGLGNIEVAGPQNPVQDATPAIVLLTGTVQNAGLAIVSSSSFPSGYASTNSPTNFGNYEPVTALLNGFGGLTSFYESSFGTATSGTSKIAVAGNDGIIAWGRWIGGTAGDGSTNLAPSPDGLGPLHYVVGLPVTNMPSTGSAVYDAIGATASCVSGCSSAYVTSSQLKVDFGNLNGSVAMNLNVNGSAVSFAHSDGSLTLNGGGSANFSANANNGLYQMNGAGFLAGNGASRAGMAYSVTDFESTRVNGVVAYKQTSTSPNGLGLAR
jgi:hypothetical protein